MATHLRENTSVDSAVDIVDSIAAALESDPLTTALSPVWSALVTRGDALIADLTRVRRVARRARSRVAVLDAIWDALVRGFDRAALDSVGGHKLSPSYQQYWSAGTSGEITRFGIDREVDVGRGILALLAPAAHVINALADTWRPKLGPATDDLEAASRARRDAVIAMGPYLTAEYLYVEDVNLELDRLEGQLQNIFPGDAKRVASYLMATRRDSSGVPDAAPAPTATSASPGGP